MLAAPAAAAPLLRTLDAAAVAALLAVGGVVGALSALMNLGSGMVLVPALALGLGLPQLAAQGMALAVTLPVSAPAALLHASRGSVAGGILGPLCVGGVLGTALMAYYAHVLGHGPLRILYALFLLAVGLSMLLTRRLAPTAPPDRPQD